MRRHALELAVCKYEIRPVEPQTGNAFAGPMLPCGSFYSQHCAYVVESCACFPPCCCGERRFGHPTMECEEWHPFDLAHHERRSR